MGRVVSVRVAAGRAVVHCLDAILAPAKGTWAAGIGPYVVDKVSSHWKVKATCLAVRRKRKKTAAPVADAAASMVGVKVRVS